jgi:hypothetical protein
MLDTMSRVRAADSQSPASNSTRSETATSAAVQILSDADLESILSRINHARFVVFETPNPYAGGTYSYQASRARATKTSQSTIAYYENAYLTREGGRRIARGDFDDVQMLMSALVSAASPWSSEHRVWSCLFAPTAIPISKGWPTAHGDGAARCTRNALSAELLKRHTMQNGFATRQTRFFYCSLSSQFREPQFQFALCRFRAVAAVDEVGLLVQRVVATNGAGVALSGSVAPIICRDRGMAFWPSSTIATTGVLVMNSTRREKRLFAMFSVVLLRQFRRDVHHLQRDELEAALFKAGQISPDKPRCTPSGFTTISVRSISVFTFCGIWCHSYSTKRSRFPHHNF